MKKISSVLTEINLSNQNRVIFKHKQSHSTSHILNKCGICEKNHENKRVIDQDIHQNKMGSAMAASINI